MAEGHLQSVAEAYERWSRGDFEGAAALCTDDVAWHPHIDIDARVHNGRDEVAQMFRDRAEQVGLRLDFSRMEEVGDKVLVHMVAEVTGEESAAEADDWFQLHWLRDGLMCRVEAFDTREEAVTAAGSG
jgi:ketosteroid isomerase-like protein